MIFLKRLVLAVALVALPLVGHAVQVCDFEHHCYEDTPQQHYHMDLAHPDVETPPPAPQYPSSAQSPALRSPGVSPEMEAGSALQSGRDIVVQPNAGGGCHLFRIRSVPNIEPQIVEICPIPPDEERAIRERANSSAGADAGQSLQ